jgi:hypothetical protein
MFKKIKTMFSLSKEEATRKATSKNWKWCLETNPDGSRSVYRLLEKLGYSRPQLVMRMKRPLRAIMLMDAPNTVRACYKVTAIQNPSTSDI